MWCLHPTGQSCFILNEARKAPASRPFCWGYSPQSLLYHSCPHCLLIQDSQTLSLLSIHSPSLLAEPLTHQVPLSLLSSAASGPQGKLPASSRAEGGQRALPAAVTINNHTFNHADSASTRKPGLVPPRQDRQQQKPFVERPSAMQTPTPSEQHAPLQFLPLPKRKHPGALPGHRWLLC